MWLQRTALLFSRGASLLISMVVLYSMAKSEDVDDQMAGWLCPPPSTSDVDPTLCDEPQCLSDEDCIKDTETPSENNTMSDMACCYNGCVDTCTKKLEPPIAFDWLEEFRQNEEGMTVDLAGNHETLIPTRQQIKAVPQAITVLPGGCVLTPRQYEELEGFRKHSHVEKCFCDKGGVSCEVTRKNLTESDIS